MAEDAKSFTWQTGVAISGLLISVFGNWMQYQTLLDKKTELAQAQAKIDATAKESSERKASREAKRREMEGRMTTLDGKVAEAEMELRRGASGMAFAPLDQRPLAAEIMRTASAQKALLLEQKKTLQDKIDALPTD
jgi:polyhydroxyalkanoate synthesis regulator protein